MKGQTLTIPLRTAAAPAGKGPTVRPSSGGTGVRIPKAGAKGGANIGVRPMGMVVAPPGRPGPTAHPGSMPQGSDSARRTAGERTVTVRNLPTSWTAPSASQLLHTKITEVLEKFGTLDGPPVLSRTADRGVCVIAKFLDRASAQATVEMLNGRDNRGLPRGAKWEPNYRPPLESDKFSVSLVAGSVRSAPGSSASGSNAAVSLQNSVDLSAVPADWGLREVNQLLEQHGDIEEVQSMGPGHFKVTFGSPTAAQQAASKATGLQVKDDSAGGSATIRCEYLGRSSTGHSKVSNGAGLAHIRPSVAQTAAPSSDPALDGPLMLHVDELHLAIGSPAPTDREIFLRNLPLEDCSEKELRDWLNGFGMVDSATFIRDGVTDQLTGCAYVRFNLHCDAAAMVATHPIDDDSDVQGAWSLSERLQKGAKGVFGEDVLGTLIEKLKTLQSVYASLTIVGDGCEARSGLGLLGHRSGPLRFAWLREDSGGVIDLKFRARLSQTVAKIVPESKAVEATPRQGHKIRVAKGSREERKSKKDKERRHHTGHDEQAAVAAPVDDTPVSYVLVRGFPSSWTDQQVRIIFALYGGVESVEFITGGRQGCAARVKLKDASKTMEVVGKLNNTRVGDGEIIEKCTVSCEFVEIPPAGKAPPPGPPAYPPYPGGLYPPPGWHGQGPAYTHAGPYASPKGAPPPPPPGVHYAYPGYSAPPPPPPGQWASDEAESAVAPGDEAAKKRRRRHKEGEERDGHKEHHGEEHHKEEQQEGCQPKRKARRKTATPGDALDDAANVGPPSEDQAANPHDEAFVKREIAHGVSLIHQGRKDSEAGEITEAAYEKYVCGLQYLLKLDKDLPEVAAVQKKIGQYIEEAERLKDKLEAVQGSLRRRSGNSRDGADEALDGARPAHHQRVRRTRRDHRDERQESGLVKQPLELVPRKDVGGATVQLRTAGGSPFRDDSRHRNRSPEDHGPTRSRALLVARRDVDD